MIHNTDTLSHVNRHMSVADFALYGAEELAYIKPVIIDGAPKFAIYAADGQVLAFIEERALAELTVRQNDMEPLSVH